MIRIVHSLLLSSALALLSLSAQAVEPGQKPLLLVGERGLEVTVATIADEGQALVKMTGVDHPVNGVVFLADVEERSNDGRAYRVEVDGKTRSLLVYAPSYWAVSDYSGYIPGIAEPQTLKVSEEDTRQLSLDQLTAEYKEQKSQGLQEKLAQFDRDKATLRQQAALKKIDGSASQVCGGAITTSVPWSSLSEEQLNHLSISGYCGQVAAEMEYLCRRNNDLRQKLAEIKAIDCSFNDKLSIQRNEDTLVFTTAKDEPNQRDLISNFLSNL